MNERRTAVPKWLQALMENSWELELLISGGAVFTLVQAPDLFLTWMRKASLTNDEEIIYFLTILGVVGLKILTNGFILHIILRSFWLALVCVNYVFPQGINEKNVNLKSPFKTNHINGDLQNQIMNVDRLSGLVIFMAILGTILFTGIVILFFSFLTIGMNFGGYFLKFFGGKILFLAMFSGLVSFLLYIIDLITMGLFRKIPFVSYLVYPFFIVYDIITLRPFYDRAMFLFTSNVRRWQFRLGALVFAIITGATSYNSFSSNLQYTSFIDQRKFSERLSENPPMHDMCYADQITPDYYPTVYIPSMIIENNFLRVGVNYKKSLDELIGYELHIDSSKYIDQFLIVSIDDSLYTNVTWRQLQKRDVTNLAIESVIDISFLSNGIHLLKVKPKTRYEKKLRFRQRFRNEFTDIYFWKDVH
jgi:hypothetical protein